MKNNLCVLIGSFVILMSCSSEKIGTSSQLGKVLSWDIIDGIMLKDWDKEKIEKVIGKPGKSIANNTSIYFDQDTKNQNFAIEYNSNQKVTNLSFSPQEHELSEFTLNKIKIHWEEFNCLDKNEQIVHPDNIETKYWLACSNNAKVFYNVRKEVLFLTLKK